MPARGFERNLSRVRQVLHWREEYRHEAQFLQFLAQAAFVAENIERFLSGPEAAQPRERILSWMSLLVAEGYCEQAFIFDPNGVSRLSFP